MIPILKSTLTHRFPKKITDIQKSKNLHTLQTDYIFILNRSDHRKVFLLLEDFDEQSENLRHESIIIYVCSCWITKRNHSLNHLNFIVHIIAIIHLFKNSVILHISAMLIKEPSFHESLIFSDPLQTTIVNSSSLNYQSMVFRSKWFRHRLSSAIGRVGNRSFSHRSFANEKHFDVPADSDHIASRRIHFRRLLW